MSEADFDPSAGVDPGADAGSPEDAPGVVEPDGTPDSGLAPEEGSVPAPGWAPTQEDWSALTGTVQQLAGVLTPAPAAPQAPQFVQADPDTGESLLDPTALQAYIDFQINQGVNSRLAPVEPILNQTIADRGEAVIQEQLTKLQSEVGTFDPQVVRQIAEGIAARGNVDPFQAIRQAAELGHAAYKSIGEAAVAEYRKTLSAVGGAPRDPGGSGGGAGVESESEIPVGHPDRYKMVGQRWAARQTLPV